MFVNVTCFQIRASKTQIEGKQTWPLSDTLRRQSAVNGCSSFPKAHFRDFPVEAEGLDKTASQLVISSRKSGRQTKLLHGTLVLWWTAGLAPHQNSAKTNQRRLKVEHFPTYQRKILKGCCCILGRTGGLWRSNMGVLHFTSPKMRAIYVFNSCKLNIVIDCWTTDYGSSAILGFFALS